MNIYHVEIHSVLTVFIANFPKSKLRKGTRESSVLNVKTVTVKLKRYDAFCMVTESSVLNFKTVALKLKRYDAFCMVTENFMRHFT